MFGCFNNPMKDCPRVPAPSQPYQKVFGKDAETKSTVKMVAKYFNEFKTEEKWVEDDYTPISTGLTTGAISGTAVGLLAGGPKGAAIGFAGGAVGGMVIGVGVAIYNNSKSYKEWLKTYKETEVINEFETMNRQHPLLAKYVDVLSQDVMRHPVRDSRGNRWEKEEILIHINVAGKDGVAACPKRNGTISKDELVDDFAFLVRMKKDLAKALSEDQAYINASPEIKEGMAKFIEETEKQIDIYFHNEVHELQLQLKNRQINIKTYTEKFNQLCKDLEIEG